jgi:hypothetical protein
MKKKKKKVPKKYQEQIGEIFENFDWKRVFHHMTKANWTWASTCSVPDIPNMKRVANDLLSRLATSGKDVRSTATGGFRAYWFKPGTLALMFLIEDYIHGEKDWL